MNKLRNISKIFFKLDFDDKARIGIASLIYLQNLHTKMNSNNEEIMSATASITRCVLCFIIKLKYLTLNALTGLFNGPVW